jgi:hypothetical protein
MNIKKIEQEITIFKLTVSKNKHKKDVLISFPESSGYISAFDFLSKYVSTDAITKGLTVSATEYGYDLFDSNNSLKYRFVIE